MPHQSRGFWCCDFCQASFDTFDEARIHEFEQCPSRPPQQTPIHGGRHHHDPYSVNTTMATMSTPVFAPISGEYGEYETGRRGPIRARCLPLLGPDGNGNLGSEDSVACRHIEIFEASPEHVSGPHTDQSIELGQVGLRCCHCASNPPAPVYSSIFPVNTGNMATSVRLLADEHLVSCQVVPAAEKEILNQAFARRQRHRGDGRPPPDEDERNLMALRDHCIYICESVGLVNSRPPKTGIVFGDTEAQYAGSAYPQYEPPPQRPGPPSNFRHSSMGPSPPVPRHPQGAMIPLGNEPVAPTPLMARRRDRPPIEGGDLPPSIHGTERDGTFSGYPTPYSHNTAPPHESVFGGPDDRGAYTPAQPATPMEGGPEGTTPTPRSLPPSEASPVPGYRQSPPVYDLPSNFPFYQEPNGTWNCKFCSHLHPQYRDPQWIWPNHFPPPGHFIDQHLGMCRGYQQNMPLQQLHQGPPPPPPPNSSYSYLSYPHQARYPPLHYGPPRSGWDTPGQAQGPTGRPHPTYPTPGPGGDTSPYSYAGHPPRVQSRFGERSSGSGFPPARSTSAREPVTAAGSVSVETAVRDGIEYLASADKKRFASETRGSNKVVKLVLDDDRLLLTDYFFYLMKQLRLCRFSESDRKTRGGKREKIQVGYGGLQCLHCAGASNSRKFFWSNVDRLANSFAEIPSHVLKCRHCPQQTKDALLQLKQVHPEQMARLPRGAQKVFFRRMWRRLHDEDPEKRESSTEGNPNKKVATGTPKREAPEQIGDPSNYPEAKDDSPGTAGSDESFLAIQRSPQEAARTLAKSTTQTAPPSPSSRVLLAIPDDKEWLSDMDCFVRRQIEVFCATQEDITTAQLDRKYPVHLRQVGIRCIHCALSKDSGASGTAVAYPFSISGIYESVREFQRLHLDSCENLPKGVKTKLLGFKGSSSLSSVLRKYYVLAAKALGLQDTRDGIRSGAESISLGSQAAFAFSEGNSPLSEDTRLGSGSLMDTGPTITPLESRKRKQLHEPKDGDDRAKKPSGVRKA